MATVLIVDDEKSVREVIRESVAALGHQVEEASDGLEALDRFRSRRYDVVITDIAMPNMDGIELTNRLKKLDPQVAVLMVTGLTSLDLMALAWNRGICEYIQKPIRLSTLQDTLERAVQNQRSEVPPAEGPGKAPPLRRPSRTLALLALLAAALALICLWLLWDDQIGLRALSRRVGSVEEVSP